MQEINEAIFEVNNQDENVPNRPNTSLKQIMIEKTQLLKVKPCINGTNILKKNKLEKVYGG